FQDLASTATLAADIRGAFDRAGARRTPVILNVPLDLQTADVANGWTYAPPPPARSTPLAPTGADVRRIAEAIARSDKPLILAGRGAVWAGARAALEQLGDRIGALLGTTLLAKGFFRGSEWY